MFSLSAVRSFPSSFLKSVDFAIVSIASMSLCALNASGQASFERQDVNVGAKPTSIVSADFNRDGIADLAVTLSGSNAVAVLLGKGDGQFASPASYVTGPNPLQLIVADFNHDGNPDLAVLNQGNATISVLLGNGDGTFRPKSDIGSGSGIVAGDFNRDGFDDIAAITGTTTVSIYLSNGSGGFRRVDTSAGENHLTAIAAGDFNRDGIPDVVVTDCCHNPDVPVENNYLLVGNGDGTFRPQSPAFTTSGLIDVSTGDLDNNGVLDLIIGYAGCHTPCHGMRTALSKGDGTFSPGPATNISALQFGGPTAPRIADFDGDGTNDIAMVNIKNDQQFGGGADHSVMSIFFISGGKVQVQQDIFIGEGARGLALADFNRDGKPDAATANNTDGTISVLLNTTGKPVVPVNTDFALKSMPTTATINRGQSATYTLIINPVNGAFNNPVSFSCSGFPAGASCNFSPNAVTPGTSGATSTLTITTTPQTAFVMPAKPFYAMWVSIHFLTVGLVFATSEGRRRGRRRLAVLALGFCLLTLSSCGGGGGVKGAITPLASGGNSPAAPPPAPGGGSSSPSTAPTTHSIVVTGTSGSVQHSLSLGLTIQ